MSSQGSGVRRFSGLHGTTHFCLKPDGKTAFILDRAHHTFAQIDLTTGKETLAEIEAPSQLKNPQIWRRLIFLKRAARLYLIALIFDEITKIVYLVSFAEKGSLNFAVVCVYELPNNDKFTANWGVVQEDEKGRIFCVGSRKCPKRDNITIFDTVMVEIDDNGTITSLADNFLAKKQALTGKWSNPFVYSDAMHFLACEYRRRWDGDRINFEHMLNVPLNQKVIRSTVVDLTDNSGCWPAGSSFWSFSPAIIGERAYFYVSQKHHHHSTGALFYLDLKENNWKSWEFLTDDHVLDSYIEIAASEDGRTLCLSGNCALESCVEKAHIYVLNVDEQAKIKNTASLSTRKPDQTTTISPPVPKPRAIHHEEHEQQNSHGTTKPLTKVQQEIAKVNEGTKKLTLGSEQNTNGTRVSQQSHSLPSQANGQKSKYMPGKYEKQEKIGSGAFGVVHKCWDIEQQRLFAAKYTVLQSDENYAMAQNEIQRLKDLDHPRVIDYYGCSTEHDRVVLFMEYMVAGSLRRVIDKHGPISEKNSIHYIDQILDGLTYIHGRGIVHRDLKCDNLLLDGQGNIKLGDFGIAIEKYLSTNNQSFFSKSASSLGTLHWMAPELIDNKGASRCSDIWSLGCTIVEMLTGDPPYGNISALRFVGAVCNKSLSYEIKDLIPKASDKMQQFVSCMLQAEPEKRPHTGADATAKFKQLF